MSFRELIFSIFLLTCPVDHQLNRGLEYWRNTDNSSKDSTNGAPNVSGNNNANAPATKVVDPKISMGNPSNVTAGRYIAT